MEIKPKYVPFRDAKDFEPHRDKWFKRLNESGCVQCSAYDDIGVWFVNHRIEYSNLLSDRQFDDGKPAGRLSE